MNAFRCLILKTETEGCLDTDRGKVIKMLQQILKDMFIDPELLAELSDEQKQILFLKMREEQVKRWNEYDEKMTIEETRKPPKLKPKSGKKRVEFLTGTDGNEWVWVMGEHRDDKTIEQILEDEAHEKARIQAEREAEELRKKEEEAIRKKLEEEKKRLEEERENERRKKEEEALYQSIKEARILAQKAEEERQRKEEEEKRLKEAELVQRRKSLTKIENVQKRRSDEIYTRWKAMRQQLDKVAEETSKELEKSWMEQEKKAKEAEQQMKLIAQRAREENRHSITNAAKLIMNANRFTQGEKPPLPPKESKGTSAVLEKNREIIAQRRKTRPARPPDRESVINWFHQEEKEKKTVFEPKTSKIANWFHGVISRMDAEKLLLEKPQGTYLVRVSEKVWGYTISYRASDRCKHFLIDASEDIYHFFGPNQLPHNSIVELVTYHKENPITLAGQEKLLYSCGQTSDPPDYWDLFQNRRTESTSL